jgi:signal transduction histidine kinase
MPPRGTLVEIATLAAGLQARRAVEDRARRADAIARTGRRAAAAAHDLRNELTRALLHAARDGDGDAGEVVAALGAARELAQSALHADPGLHDAARPDLVDLRGVLVEEARAASTSARVPRDGAPELRVKCPNDLAVLAEPSALGRALRNLITNGLEASARGPRAPGRVEVVAERGAADAAGFGVRVTVRDDGDGVPPEHLACFLEDRLLAGRAEHAGPSHGKPASTGLGTASLRLALEALGAPFRIESAAGRGASASLRLRAAPAARPVVVVDPDVRRGVRRASELFEADGEIAWVVARSSAALALLSRDHVRRVECVRGLADPTRRAALARACGRQRVPLRWLDGATAAVAAAC